MHSPTNISSGCLDMLVICFDEDFGLSVCDYAWISAERICVRG